MNALPPSPEKLPGDEMLQIMERLKIDLFFDPERQRYYWRNRNKSRHFTSMGFKAALAQLKLHGIPAGKPKEGGLSPAETILAVVQTDCQVDYAGPLPGKASGIHPYGQSRLLCTSECTVLNPEPGDCQELYLFLQERFPNPENLHRFLAWLFHAHQCLHKGAWAPLPVLILVGPIGSFKTFLIELLRFLLGDRPEAKAMRYLSNDTGFNADLIQSVLLSVDDEFVSTRGLAVDTLAAKIKAIATQGTQRIEGKGRDAVVLPTHHRLVIAANSDPENLRVLPPVREDTRDKLLLLSVAAGNPPAPMNTAEDKKLFMDRMKSQLPAMLHHLAGMPEMQQFGSRDQRYAVDGYQDPEILDLVQSSTNEMILLDLIDRYHFQDHSPCWGYVRSRSGPIEVKAADLMQALLQNDSTRHAARPLLSSPQACGMYLSRLARSHPERVRRIPPIAGRYWEISPPQPPAPVK